jgi:hypothetical protein
MHIAVLIYGRLNKCAEHYSNIINSVGTEHTIHFFASSDNASEEQMQTFINVYNPVSYINDAIHYTCNIQKYPGIRGETNIHNMTCHFINKSRVYALLEEYINKTNAHYDIVISLRVDLVFDNNFIFSDVADDIIYVPNCYDHIDNALNDQVAYGSVSSMKKYMNIFHHIFTILDTGRSIPHPESLTFANAQFNNLKVHRFELDYHIER